MRLLIVHFSDIHLRVDGNPVLNRLDPIIAAIRSVAPVSSHCLVLVTGDLTMSGAATEFEVAYEFFDAIRKHLAELFQPGNLRFDSSPEITTVYFRRRTF
jgi:hypothetical protein